MNGLLSVFSKINVPSILRHIVVLLAQFSSILSNPLQKDLGADLELCNCAKTKPASCRYGKSFAVSFWFVQA